MKRQVLYSGSRRAPGATPGAPAVAASFPETQAASDVGRKPRFARVRSFVKRRAGILSFTGGAALVALLAAGYFWSQPRPQALTQAQIDASVLHTLNTKPLPSRAMKAAEIVRPSIVRVRGFGEPEAKGKAKRKAKSGERKSGRFAPGGAEADKGFEGLEETQLGSGVVIVENGVILTNLHVVYGAQRVKVTFHDGSESEADLVSVHPENDLAVIKARKIPDDLPPATLGSAGRLKPGDEVVAVGFPFGVGPSVSAGVVSGLDREFRSPDGDRLLTRLIQFDAAANPGSSGGPLVTMQGDVVGIVTAILNPNGSRTFVGIGFAVTIAAAGRAVGVHPF